MTKYYLATALIFMLGIAREVQAADADCYDKGDFYYIPASDLLAAKKKALLCFFAEITVRSSSREDNRNIEFKQETSLEATSSVLDWQGLRKADAPNLYRWAIKDVNDNLKRLATSNTKKMIPVEKEVQEVWHSDAIKKEVIEINSNPANAIVTFDGVDHACQTPCKLEVLHGSHAITLWKPDYSRVSGTISVDSSHDKFSFELRENISRVSFLNCPAGTEIRVDGNRFGDSSNGTLKLAPGSYIIELDHGEYFKEIQKISVDLGDNLTLTCGLKPKIGGIDISARNARGEPVKANVEVDGVTIGKTPSTFDVRAGSRRVRVSTADEAWEDTVTVTKSSTLPIVARLKAIESEEEKALRQAYRSFALMLEIGSMNEIKINERASGAEYKFADCSDSADPNEGDTLRLFLSKNITNHFGINFGYIHGNFEACHRTFVANQYEPQINRFSVAFNGPSVGLNYALVNQLQGDQSAYAKNYTRWFDLRLSYIPNLDLSIQNNQTRSIGNSRISGVTLAECSVATMTFNWFKLSLINLSYLKGIEKSNDVSLKLGEFSMFSIIGLGLAF